MIVLIIWSAKYRGLCHVGSTPRTFIMLPTCKFFSSMKPSLLIHDIQFYILHKLI
ncbi:unnamed protein product [Phytomonas sp. EM1]|nr:unnamed protein product [Phytomonas sp. EM1]|eukprot:CCW63471.1 unnamed protein product [Phytomonas sp. isolate EM1]